MKELLGDNNKTIELDIVFEYYTSASALHHFEVVSKLLKNPFKLAILMKNDQKDQGSLMVEP